MEIQYKKLTEKELDTFIQMRINQLKEEGATEEIDLGPALRDYYDRHMSDGTFVSWLAKDGEKIVGYQRNVIRGKTTVFRMSVRENRVAFKYVH